MANLPRGKTELSKDNRRIKIISWDDIDGSSFWVGSNGCTQIIAYDENGEMARTPWLAVFKGTEIVCRVPAWKVSIHYFEAV